MKLRIEDFIKYLEVENNRLNLLAIKELIASMDKKGLIDKKKQQIIFDEELFNKVWNIYYEGLEHYDVNYNRKEDLKTYFTYLLENILEGKETNYFALFCPGYTDNGYKPRLGHTTIWKLEELDELMKFYEEKGLKSNLISCYSDVFLENTNYEKNSNWEEELDYNRKLFHEEANKYFPKEKVINASDLSIFKGKENIEGFIDKDIIDNTRKKIYKSILISNKKFYDKLGFTEEEMIFRNDRLITMYKILSDYLNEQDNMVFLPMENMYERENIFSENKTCTMYLKLKK